MTIIFCVLCIFSVYLLTLEVSYRSADQEQQKQWQEAQEHQKHQEEYLERLLDKIKVLEDKVDLTRLELSRPPPPPPPLAEKQQSIDGPRRPKIYDHFLCNDEMDMIEIRFRELDSVVDRFFIFEANETFSGIPKPLYFQQHRDRFKQYEHKITHIVLPNIPYEEKNRIRSEGLLWPGWEIEVYERNQALLSLFKDPETQEGDWIIISDIDEIPRADALRALTAATEQEQEEENDEEKQKVQRGVRTSPMAAPWVIPKNKDILRLQCQYFQFSYEYKSDFLGREGPVLLRYREENSTRLNPTRDQEDVARGIKTEAELEELRKVMDRNWINGGNHLRMARQNQKLPQIHESCWHCSFCLPKVEDLVRKVESFSHHEYNQGQFKTVPHIVAAASQGRDIFSRQEATFIYVPDNRDVPLKLREEYEDPRYDYLLRRHGRNHTGGFVDIPEPTESALIENNDAFNSTGDENKPAGTSYENAVASASEMSSLGS
ncbi:beta-1,4-mannosyl-glycoprotein beta-1,4-N-acetylglucosaminyltransferase [Entomortierella parvispora]|uniref:Beta-1,4-mannosyl-glycoprotein beta-1,4-N-acetylglucosaminyltransferase n=1 Tax=Entomortierella parvispora TaxID=205924 RepID=A0A9P3M241_9FUNG|nr:beta-1,4-mannosyl-glycoprotein beta-1,4-N-acetylglucosaminyltransferase [Entomortierella parvispora]